MSFFDNQSVGFAKMQKLAFAIAVCSTAFLTLCSVAPAQNNGNNLFGFNQVVGGISIDADGVLNGQRTKLANEIRAKLVKGVNGVSTDANKSGLRIISVNGLNKAIAKAKDSGTPLDASIKYLAGLQRIEYVIQSPETNDILLAGPGEPFVVNDEGQIVGKDSGAPVIHLQDFLVAMRTVDNARSGYGISISIDPSEQGTKRLNKMLSKLNNFNQHLARQAEEVMGPQAISLTGVPTNSRYAQILVSADYKMKRLSMGLEKTPEYLPSLTEMAQKRDVRFRKMAPRFWMECNYKPVAVSTDNNVWHISGSGVKTLTDEQYFDKDGKKHAAKGKENKLAKKWADSMTENFERLSQDEPVFRELRNLMDLSIVAAIIKSQSMVENMDVDISAIAGTQPISVPTWNVPQQVPTQCNFVKLSKSWCVTASGGVEIDSWKIAKNTKKDSSLNKLAAVANDRTADRWWWNAN